jgi:CRISPR-associated endonuclease Cas2
MKKSTKKNLTLVKEILLGVCETSKDIQEIFTNPHQWENYPKRNKKTIYDTVYRLEEQGYLKKVEAKGRKKYIATLKGKAKILAYLRKDKKWDGKWRIVVFDIPETKKKMRNFFREKLFDLGFRKLQESVWISPYNIADTVEELIELCDAKPYIHYLLVEELDNRDVLTKLFKLNKD